MRARASRVVAIVGLALGIVGGCKSVEMSGPLEVADDIDAIERALAERGAELEAAGVVVAYRDVREPTPIAPTAEEHLGDDSGTQPGTDVAPVTPTPSTDAPAEPTMPTEIDNAPAPSMAAPGAASREDVREHRRTKRPGARKVATEEAARCERLWGLAESTCGLSSRVCALFGRHPGDIRYAVACRRAEDQCAAARELCESCPNG
jgi:hypothetical protein